MAFQLGFEVVGVCPLWLCLYSPVKQFPFRPTYISTCSTEHSTTEGFIYWQ